MNTNVYFPTPRTTGATKALWGAIAVLGISTLAMGAALVQVRTSQADTLAQTPLAHTAGALAMQAPAATAVKVAPPAKAKELQQAAAGPAKHARPASPANTTPVSAATTNTQATPTSNAPSAGSEPQDHSPMRQVANTQAAVCQGCGTVESVTPVQRETAPVGVGAVAGAVLGGIVANQVGQGDGKTLATILGVLGGGWAGHTVEKKMKVQTIYEVQVRMDDGTTRTLEQATAPAVGTRVTVQDNTLGPVPSPATGNSSVGNNSVI